MNCSVCPLGTLGLAGVTAIDCRTAAVTVSTVEPLRCRQASPRWSSARGPRRSPGPAASDGGHTRSSADAQVTWLVRSCVELSEKVPVAVNCSVSPLGDAGLAGVTAIDWRAAALTVRTVEPLMPPSVALIVEVPVATAVARPCEPAVLEIVATEVVADAQVTWLVRSCVELSEKVPIASNCSVYPWETLGLAGVTAIEVRVGAAGVTTNR